MSGFGGRTNQADSTAIAGEGWPDLSTGEFRKIRRVSPVFDNDSIAMAISIAGLNVQGQLAKLLVDGKPPELNVAKQFTYKRAVYGRAHADLLPQFATQDQRQKRTMRPPMNRSNTTDFWPKATETLACC